MKEGGEGGAKFADVDDDPGRLGRGCKAASACDTGVDCAEELFLRVGRCGAFMGDSKGHVLDDALATLRPRRWKDLPLFP